MEQGAISVPARSKFDIEPEFSGQRVNVIHRPNVRRYRRNDGEGRLLSQSAFNRITETLGALNKVGSFFLNMTREVKGGHGQRGDMQLVSSSSQSLTMDTEKPTTSEQFEENTAFPPTPSNSSMKIVKMNQNSTKKMDVFITPQGQGQETETKVDKQTQRDEIAITSISEKIDMAALAEKKRKKHQAVGSKIDTLTVHTASSTTLSPGNYYCKQ